MKNIIGLVGLICCLSFCNTNSVAAQVIVMVRPAAPAVVVTKPIKARRGYTWVPGHWHYSHRISNYVWKKGHWQRNRTGHHYVAGRWISCAGGHKWVAGSWRPVQLRTVRKPVKRTVVVHTKPRRVRIRR